jgi:hypothetical protein
VRLHMSRIKAGGDFFTPRLMFVHGAVFTAPLPD